MSYFEAATAGYDLTPYLKRRISRFFRDAESALIVRSDMGYLITVGDQVYPLEYSMYDAIESLQSLLVSQRVEDCLPFAVVIKYESETSWVVDMDAAVRDTQYALSETLKN
jgi:hypothetical protein